MQYRNLVIILLVDLTVWYSVFTSGTLLPLLMRSNQIPEGTIGFLVGLYSIGAVISRFSLGWAIDFFGSKKFILVTCLVWAASSIVIAFSPTIPIIAICRLLQGGATGLFTTSVVVYASLSIHPVHRGKIVGVVETFSATAISISPITAVWLSEAGGYPTAFIVSTIVIGLGLIGALSLPDLRTHSLEEPSKKPFRVSWGDPAILIPGIIGAAFFLAGSAMVGMLPLLGEKSEVSNIGLLVSLRALGTIPTRLASGFISDRYGFPSVLIPGFMISAISIFLLPSIQDPIAPYYISALFGFGMGLVSPSMASWTMSRVPISIRATAVNNYITIAELAGFFGIWFIGFSLESGSLSGFYFLGGILLLGFIMYLANIFPKSMRKGNS